MQVHSSTLDKAELRDRYMWISLLNNAYDGDSTGYDIFDDIIFLFQDAAAWCADHECPSGDPLQSYGGHNHSPLATAGWCATWNHVSPCGYFPSTIHINRAKWDITSVQGRTRLLLHETGHSVGFTHYCKGDSIMNDGASTCNRGRWPQITGWERVDRQAFWNVYPFYPYP